MKKIKLLRLVRYVNDAMDKGYMADNISISLPVLDEKDLTFLRQHFATVKPQGFLGYVTFKRAKAAMKLFLVAAVLFSGQSAQAMPSQALKSMATYADNAILNAAEHGHKKVVLVFGDSPLEDIEKIAAGLRSRGYRLNEETGLLNPRIIKVEGR